MTLKRKITSDEIESYVRGVRCRMNNGSWTLFFNVSKVRRAASLHTKDPAIAAKILRLAEDELTVEARRLGELSVFGARTAAGEDVTVKDAVAKFLEAAPAFLGADTIVAYRNRLENYVTGRAARDTADAIAPSTIAHLPVKRVTKQDIKTVLRAVRQRKNGNGQRNGQALAQGVLGVLQRLFRWLIEEDLYKDREGRDLPNPAARLLRHTFDKEVDDHIEQRGRIFEPAERDGLLAHLRATWGHWAYTFAIVGFKGGLRIGEIIALQIEDVDFEQGVLHVRRRWTPKAGILPGTKSKRRGKNTTRDLPLNLSHELTEALRKQVTDRKKQNLERGWKDNPWLFVGRRDGRTLKRSWFYKHIWYKALAATGLGMHDFHDTRHTFASTLLVRSNGNVDFVARCLGDLISITEKTYLHIIQNLKPNFPGALDDESRVLHVVK
jgi:integrase